MNWRKMSLANIIIVIFVMVTVFNVYGKIPEPENIIYGVTTEDCMTVVAKINGEEIASFSVSSFPDVAPYYILRLPIDSLEPQDAGTARPGDSAEIYIDGKVVATDVIVGEKGTITKLHLTTEDSDADGMLDVWEISYFGSLTVSDGSGDTDQDGLSDLEEFLRDTNPTTKTTGFHSDIADIAVDHGSLEFGSVVINGGSSTRALTVSNNGEGDLIIGFLFINDSTNFSLTNDSCSGQTIAHGGSRTVQIIFDATLAGEVTATLTVPSNDPDTPNLEIVLSGTGIDSNVIYVCNTDSCNCNGNLPCCNNICDGYAAADEGSEIKVSDGFYIEGDLTFNEDINIILSGGWDTDYSDNSGHYSIISNSLTITTGTVIVEGIVIEGTTSLVGVSESKFSCWMPEYWSQESFLR